MKAKEEAKEIYDQMKGFRLTNAHRKKCAIVCVDRQIKAITKLISENGRPMWLDSHFYHLTQVKKEIQSL